MSGPGSIPEKPRPASTVILVREHGDDLQIYLLKRNPRSGFFPGNYVFPGGGVGSLDSDGDFWRARLDGAVDKIGEDILPFYVSAIRETFEEAGVLLGGATGESSEWFENICRRRMSDDLAEGWFKDSVLNRCCLPDFSLLFPWSHWITPEAMPRRFDTRFFVSFMPQGQVCSPDSKETVHGIWIRPEEALLSNLQGEIPLSPPTMVTLHQLLAYKELNHFKSVLEARNWGEPILPRLVRLSKGVMLVEPWDPLYDQELEVDADSLANEIAHPSEPFSRIWFHEGLWKPVRSRG